MRKTVLGFGAALLVTTGAWANDQTDDTKVAALDTSTAAFTKLDSDSDGRVSAIEAASDGQVAANFTQADADGDGYLSKEEFQSMGGTPGDTMGSETETPPQE